VDASNPADFNHLNTQLEACFDFHAWSPMAACAPYLLDDCLTFTTLRTTTIKQNRIVETWPGLRKHVMKLGMQTNLENMVGRFWLCWFGASWCCMEASGLKLA